ncbi:MAG: hypothetical protein CMJ18_04150 [Phycisphaeraceae bacterium]|nr:hypothetical protein [Phycisphaeraceae bacterium]
MVKSSREAIGTGVNSHEPVAVAVTRTLRGRIADGVYRPHEYLPSERKLAADLRTSRVTVAGALRDLEREGLVERTPGRGTRVLPVVERQDRPGIGLLHGEHFHMEQVASQDSLRTLQGARDALDEAGYRYETISVPSEHDLSDRNRMDSIGAFLYIDNCYARPQHLVDLQQNGVPVVVAKLENDLDLCATWIDHRKPMLEAVRTFVRLGHDRIAFVGRESDYGIHGEAREGYLAGLREAGLGADESLVAVCRKTDALSGYFATRSLLRLPAPPTAIAVARDAIAEGVCRAAEEEGLVLGHHLSVIGFDDTTWPEGRKFLTTFREPCYEMGAAAARMLVERIVQGPAPLRRREFSTSFVLRRTAGPCFSTDRPALSLAGAGPALRERVT